MWTNTRHTVLLTHTDSSEPSLNLLFLIIFTYIWIHANVLPHSMKAVKSAPGFRENIAAVLDQFRFASDKNDGTLITNIRLTQAYLKCVVCAFHSLIIAEARCQIDYPVN